MNAKTRNAGHGHPEKCLTELDRGSSRVDREFRSPSWVVKHQPAASADNAAKPDGMQPSKSRHSIRWRQSHPFTTYQPLTCNTRSGLCAAGASITIELRRLSI